MADLTNEIMQCLGHNGLGIMMCWPPGYDITAYMAGVHDDVQAITKAKNKEALLNGCEDHFLSLCGHHSFVQNSSCVTFFGAIGGTFLFFTS